jgi:NDP-sugar pyrophosphorylase family protein
MQLNIKAIVLAAGKGTRLQSEDFDAPKVMREVGGKPLLSYVLESLSFIDIKDIVLVVGYKRESIIERFEGYTYAVQGMQLGTGHAVMSARDQLRDYKGALLLCYGDMPAIKRDSYEQLIRTHFEEQNDCTLLSSQSDRPLAFGRVERDANGIFKNIIEEIECTPEQLNITELNTGVYVFDCERLFNALGELRNDNAQGEYYITDVPAIMKAQGAKIGILKRDLGDCIIGVNTPEQLAQVERAMTSSDSFVPPSGSNELCYEQLSRIVKEGDGTKKSSDRRQKRDLITGLPTIMSIVAWMMLAAAWIFLDQASPDRTYGWLSFFEVNYGTAAAHRARWDYATVYTAYILLLSSIGICGIALAVNRLRMRRKTDKFRFSVFFVGSVSIIAFIAFLIRFWYILF